jgi:hypothetical protein
MDYTAMATVTQTTRYHVEGLDTELGEWIRIQPDASSEHHEAGDDHDGFGWEANAISYAAVVRQWDGCKIRIVEEIMMRARRVTMEQ